jgi:hypothetical protein
MMIALEEGSTGVISSNTAIKRNSLSNNQSCIGAAIKRRARRMSSEPRIDGSAAKDGEAIDGFPSRRGPAIPAP